METLRKRDGWRCARVSQQDAARLVAALHYAKGCANTSVLRMGLFSPNGELVGVAMWMPPAPGVVGWAHRNYGKTPIALSRLVIADDVPRNAASFLLARCYKPLRSKGYGLAVSYADPLEGHTGHVYLAAGWLRAGSSYACPRWTDQGGRMRSSKSTKNLTVAEMLALGWTRRPGESKARYVREL